MKTEGASRQEATGPPLSQWVGLPVGSVVKVFCRGCSVPIHTKLPVHCCRPNLSRVAPEHVSITALGAHLSGCLVSGVQVGCGLFSGPWGSAWPKTLNGTNRLAR